jgi:predicted alpha/beta superfamily hydrolase
MEFHTIAHLCSMRYVLLPVLLLLSLPVCMKAQTATPLCIGESFRLHSEPLHEDRSINIYLPPGYRDSDTTRYHVIYLLDGSVDEDFVHVAGLVQFYTFPWIEQLPPTIVVGIANVDRRRDFTFPTHNKTHLTSNPTSGHSAPFLTFIGQELIPAIESKYRCSDQRTLIGQSLGGLLAAEILLRKPQLFNRYLIISPSLWWDNGSLLAERFGPLNQKTAVHIAVGKEGLVPGSKTETMEGDAKAFSEKLRQMKDPMLRVSFDYLPDEDHASTGHIAIMNGIKQLFPKTAAK